jgi:putative Mn2+ efflux pump MntP
MPNDNQISEVKTFQRKPEREQHRFSFNTSQFLCLCFGILEALIALRVGLKLIGANPDIPIIALIYDFTALLLIPFGGWIGAQTAGSIIRELSTMLAILVYAVIVAWAVERIVWLIFYRTRRSVASIPETTTSQHHAIP